VGAAGVELVPLVVLAKLLLAFPLRNLNLLDFHAETFPTGQVMLVDKSENPGAKVFMVAFLVSEQTIQAGLVTPFNGVAKAVWQ